MTLYSRRELHELGVSDGEVRSAVRSGSIHPVRRGFYVSGASSHVHAARAAMLASSADLAISHQSAAQLHGIDQWPAHDGRVHLTVNRRHGGRVTDQRVVHASLLHPDDVVDKDGVRVTSLARPHRRRPRVHAAVRVGSVCRRFRVAHPRSH